MDKNEKRLANGDFPSPDKAFTSECFHKLREKFRTGNGPQFFLEVDAQGARKARELGLIVLEKQAKEIPAQD